jgi:hypothetical protein
MSDNAKIDLLKKSHFRLIIPVLVISFLFSCSYFYTKDKYIEEFSTFVGDVKANCASYSEDDWINADAQFDIYAVQDYEKFQQKLTSEEKFTIGKLKGSYALLKLKKGASDIMDEAKDILDQSKGFIEGITDTINK